MSEYNDVQPLLQAVRTHYAQHRVLLVDPRSTQTTLLLAALLADPPCPVYFYQPGANDVSLETFLSGLCHELADQHFLFGRYLNAALALTPDNLERLVDAFLSDLTDLNEQDFLLLLIDFDQVDTVAGVFTFLEQVIGRLPEHCHLLFTSRTIPRLPWIQLVASRQAAVLRGAELTARF